MKSLIAILLSLSFAQGQEGALEAKDSKIEFKINNVTVVIEAGNLITLSGQAAAMPGSGGEHGGELAIGRKLKEAGAQGGFAELDRMEAANRATGTRFPPASAQIVKSGGGTYEYIINLTTQDYPRGMDIDTKTDRRFAGLTGDDLSLAYNSLKALPEMRHISESVRNLLFACIDAKYNITDVTIPFFGTGSWHGMDDLHSLVSMLNGVQRFSTTMREIKIRMVFFRMPGPEMNAEMQRIFVPLIRAEFHDEARFESHLAAMKRDPFKYTKRFLEKFLNAPTTAPVPATVVQSPSTEPRIRGGGGELPADSCAPTILK